ncbi:MAG: peptidase [Burkholderiales bacterium]|nr:peptidase [Burkholderiales bacterium]
MKPRRRVFALLATALLLASGAGPGRARDERDHDRARRALEAGEILPLRTILERVERDTPGQVMEVELERKDGRWIYEIKMLRAGGSLVKLRVDARDARLIERRERPIDDGRRRGGRP